MISLVTGIASSRWNAPLQFATLIEGGLSHLLTAPYLVTYLGNAPGIARARIGWCQHYRAQKILTFFRPIGFHFLRRNEGLQHHFLRF